MFTHSTETCVVFQGLSQCVGLFAFDPVTKKIAFFHISYGDDTWGAERLTASNVLHEITREMSNEKSILLVFNNQYAFGRDDNFELGASLLGTQSKYKLKVVGVAGYTRKSINIKVHFDGENIWYSAER